MLWISCRKVAVAWIQSMEPKMKKNDQESMMNSWFSPLARSSAAPAASNFLWSTLE